MTANGPTTRVRRGRGGAAVCLALGLAVVGCAGRVATPAAPTHDAPVPASEPRAELALVIDLVPARDCEERFDLALYAERGVELVVWGAEPAGCSGRPATIRYFPRQISREALLDAVERLTLAVKEARQTGTEQ